MQFRKRSLNAIEWLERKMYTREDLSEGILHTILYWHNLLKRWNTSSGPSTGSSGLSNRWRIRRTWKCRALGQGKVVKWKIESIRQAKLFVRRQEAEMEVGVVVWMISDNLTTSTNFDQKVNYMMTWQSIWSKLASWTYSGITSVSYTHLTLPTKRIV